jgi:hypothetical protein
MKWSIVNQAGFCHEMDFNLSFENPTLYTGWKELILHHQLSENVEIEMAYYGKAKFSIKSFKEVATAADILPFHSRSLFPGLTIFFDVKVNSESLTKNCLVKFSFFNNIFIID